MNAVLLLLVLAILTLALTLWGFLAMASWSDRQIARAWQEAKSDAAAATE